MGLFKRGKTEKAEKIEKIEQYEEHQDRSRSKHHPKKASGVIYRPMPQMSMMGGNANPFQSNFGYSPFSPNFSAYKSPFPSSSPYDLSRYPASSIPMNPFAGMQFGRPNMPPIWSNGMFPFADRAPAPQQ